MNGKRPPQEGASISTAPPEVSPKDGRETEDLENTDDNNNIYLSIDLRKGTTVAIFALRQLMERHREKQVGLHLMFIDLEKAYDGVASQEVWRCLRKKGVP
ncbi:hypothetical protein J437_LFUL015247 [Ladona fulva]|uniref:Reverse transcriptase domain-containing protein n=1 Tax=Ladona fulva TaxID=123851 RepID=A0A8K0KJC9_LADFU|nr:hypothetical protein J437_LFUL015247 [Ladona fulva]